MRASAIVVGLAAAALLVAAHGSAQTPKTQTQRRVPARPVAVQVVAREISGAPIGTVKVMVSGPAVHESATNAEGAVEVPLAAGTYRFRFEHDRFVTLERDVTVVVGQPATVTVVMSAAPPPPAPKPAPPPPSAPPPPPPPPAGSPANVSILDFIDKNFIGREAFKESEFGCTAASTTRLLQIKDPVTPHVHADADEILYTVAGEGVVLVGEKSTAVKSTVLNVVPRGFSHSIQRQGRNPLIVLSILAGPSCTAPGRK